MHERVRQDLQRDVAIELGVAPAIDLAHAACPERSSDLERADLRADCQVHRVEGPSPPLRHVTHNLRGGGMNRLIDEDRRLLAREQRFDFAPQIGIVAARVGE